MSAKPAHPSFAQILMYFTPAALIFVAVLFLFMSIEKSLFQQNLQLREKNMVNQEMSLFQTHLRNRRSDTSILSDIIRSSNDEIKDVENILRIFIANTDIYDQIRLLSPDGKEWIRINAGVEGPQTVPQNELQDKHNRPYFQDAVAAQGRIVISAFDLNVEHGKIEVPHKPVIRFSQAIYKDTGELIGVVVLNFLGQNLLDQIRRTATETHEDISLLNSSGFWLYGPDESLEWAFMFDADSNATFAARYPSVWHAITASLSGQEQTSNGLFSFARACAPSCGNKNASQDVPTSSHSWWYIVSHVPPDKLIPQWYSIALFIVLSGLVGIFIGSWILAKARAVRWQAENDLKKSESTLRIVNSTARDAILMTNPSGEILFMNPAAHHLFDIPEKQATPPHIQNIIELRTPEETRSLHDELCGKGLDEQQGLRREVVVSLPSGAQRVLELSIGVQISDAQRRIVATIRDTTDSKRLQEEVQRRGHLLEAALENMDQALIMADANGFVTAFNLRFANLFHVSTSYLESSPPVEKIIRAWTDSVSLDDVEQTWLQKTDSTRAFVVEIPGPEDKELEMRHTPTQGGGFVRTFTDITDRKEVDRALRESNDRYMSLVSQLTSVVYRRVNDISWTMEFISAGVENLTGYSASDFTKSKKRRFIDLIHIQDRVNVEDAIHEAIELRRPYLVEYRIINKNGETRWVLEKGQATYDSNDNVQFLSGVITDMTDRIKAEQELRRSWSLLQDAIDSIDAGLIMFDSNMRVVVMNRKYKEIYPEANDFLMPGVPYESVLRMLYRKGRYKQTREAEEQFVAERLATLKDSSGYERQLPNGEWVKVSRHPTRENGVVALHHNITHLKQTQQDLKDAMEAAESANKAKSEFLARMSHEIRTPMNAIIGMASIAMRTQLTPKQYDYISKIKISGNTLLNIINDILDFSKIEAGKMTIESVPFELDDVLANVSNFISFSASEKDLEVVFDVDPNLPTTFIGDPLRLGQIITNLAGNAVKFTHEGEIIISVEQEDEDESSITLRFQVSDTGIGLSDDQTARLFQSFSQADESTTRKYGGSGLGLAICKRLVTMMHGSINVTSQAGKGSIFSFTVVCGISPLQHPLEMPSDICPSHVLVAEDIDSTRNILMKDLASFGFHVKQARSADEMYNTINATKQNNDPFDILFINWGFVHHDEKRWSAMLDAISSPDRPMILAVASLKDRDLIADMSETSSYTPDFILAKPIRLSRVFDAIMYVFGISDSQTATQNAKHSTQEINISSIKGARLLVAEDNSINQEVALEILRNAGFEVDIVENGQKAIEAAHSQNYDAILMDVQMPEVDGLQATRTIRQIQDNTLPIIAMTAHAMAEDRDRCLEAGMNDYVTKPIDQNELLTALVRWITPRSTETAPKPIHVTHTTPPPQLPDVKGIQVQKLIDRLSGNTKLVRRLLEDFIKQFHDATSRIQGLQEQNATDELIQLAHALKGVAGNINADELYKVAANLEKQFKTHGASIPLEELDTFDSILSTTMTSATKFIEQSTPAPKEEAEHAPQQLSPETIQHAEELTSQLITHIQQGLLDAEDTLAQLSQLLQPNFSNQLQSIEAYLTDFDFEGALPPARELLAALTEPTPPII